ncbi:MAG: 6-pyruvoyl tetrahydropterin synthase family protein [Thermoleophilia bacterium]|nr:6-pyruvoyl tetrahydropterin synthase family protein [Thermoleophilia bacterium]
MGQSRCRGDSPAGPGAPPTEPGFRRGRLVAGNAYKVRVTKDYLVFSAGHFITYNGDECERLHGHNYRVAVEVEGPLDENHYVFDFIALRDFTKRLTDALDHRMLLPTQSPYIHLDEDGPNWRVRYRDRHWSFPRDECVLLPIPNTTAELLADYLGDRLREEFVAHGLPLPAVMRMEVEENFGQWAISEWRGGAR